MQVASAGAAEGLDVEGERRRGIGDDSRPEPEWLEGGGSTDCDGAAVRKLLYEALFMSISPVNDLAALCGGC